MLLQNLNIVGQDEAVDIKIHGNKVESLTPSGTLKSFPGEDKIMFDDVIAFPGLINSHDHLDFDLFPRLGNRKYKNYLEWGTDIHQQNKEIIQSVLKIPKQLCVYWGILKNILCGVTTVVQHGKYFNIPSSHVNIFNNSHSLHSVALEKTWMLKINNPFAKLMPFVIHIGEGTDNSMSAEVDMIVKKNFFKRKLIGVHGIAMTMEQSESFDAIVWCPDSNFFLYDATANVKELKKNTRIVFGSDSTLSAHWNIYEHFRVARKTNMLGDQELYESLTSEAAQVWNLNKKGTLACGKDADVVIAKKKNVNSSMESFYNLNPHDILLVIRNGTPVFADEEIVEKSGQKMLMENFSRIRLNGVSKKINGNLKELIRQTKKYWPDIEPPIPLDVE